MRPPSSSRTLSPLNMIISSLLCILLATASYNSVVVAWSTSSPSSSSSLVVVSPSRTSLVPSASTRRAHCYGFNNRYQSIKLSSAILPQEEEKEKAEKEQLEQLLECSSCKRSFQTRNALFRHLRGEDEDIALDCPLASSAAFAGGAGKSSEKELLLTTIIRYGYIWDGNSIDDDERVMGSNNEIVATMIQEEFVHLVNAFLAGEEVNKTDTTTKTTTTAMDEPTPTSSSCTISALTYSTAAKLRQPSLMQDEEIIAATSELLSFNYRLSMPFVRSMAMTKKWKQYCSSGKLLEDMKHRLLTANDGAYFRIQVHNIDAIAPRSYKFYAERGCTQRTYHYILPLRLLFGGGNDKLQYTNLSPEISEALRQWWRNTAVVPNSVTNKRKHQPRGGRQQGKPSTFHQAPECIQRLKRALKAAESRTIDPLEGKVDENDSTSDNEVGISDANDSKTTADPTTSTMRPSPGRFGQLWRKERRCWSNFAHPTLRGMAASPGHEAVWRTLDRARIVGFVEHNDHNSDGEETLDDDDIQGMHAILEFRGDGFLLGQIPRILSSVIAMSNGWLPENFFDVATRPDIYVRTPPMPPFLDGRLYFHSSRYHFHELIGNTGGAVGAKIVHNDKKNFENTIRGGSNTEKEWDKYLCNALLARASTNNKILEEKWLLQLRDEVSPDIQKQLEKVLDDNIFEKSLALDGRNEKDVESSTQLYTTSPTGAFSATLDLLRDVVSSGKWPATSGARSRVIKSPSQGLSDVSTKSSNSILSSKKGAVASAFPGNGISSGSFTVMNEELWDSDSGISLPNANSFFPDLARSVFLLEKEIIEKSIPPLLSADGMNRQSSPSTPRQPSTHCAVNRNAQFTPHVDSGRGQGQSLSMIVGLGNYTGGEILVEGNPYDIRYHALEFDGWKQLHWTAQFQGERYSLVWFSPEVQKESDQIDQVELSGEDRVEDLSDEDQIAETLAIKHSKRLPFLSPLQFRKYSTDALVINEILDKEKGCAYTLTSNKLFGTFSLNNHESVLDIGAHIGVFSRYALGEGCRHIIAYEPEPSNFMHLSRNLELIESRLSADERRPIIEIHSAAVTDRTNLVPFGTLVQARNQNDGKQNTWRHSLQEYSQYVDRSTKLPSESQKGTLERFTVPCVPFFGCKGETDNSSVEGAALVPGVTFVKLDCEGAELDILLSSEASKQSSWLDVTHLVVEWSFTKERRVSVFHNAIGNLREAGFEVYYEGMGSWWDTDSNVMWPYPNDLIVFAIMRDEKAVM